MKSEEKKSVRKFTAPKERRIDKFDNKYCEMLIKHMEDGFSYESFCAIANVVSKQTLYDWEKKYPQWEEAKSIAFSKRMYNLEKEMKTAATEETAGSPAVLIFRAKNLLKWTDKIENEVNLNANVKTSLAEELAKDIPK